MESSELQQLLDRLRTGDLSRRSFMRRATALGVSGAAASILARDVAAQADGTPAASPATGGATASPTREEVQAEIDAAFPFEEPAVEGGQLIHVMTTDIQTLNTTLASDVYSGWITGLLFDSLVGGSVVNGLDVPGLADSWEVAEDNVTYTIHLNQDAKWHDGEPVTADDVVFTFDGVLAEDSMSVRKGTVEEVLESYQKIDDHTVEFKAKFQSALFLNKALAQFGILPKHIWDGVAPADWGSDSGSTGQDPSRVIGSGPFKFVEWTLGDHVTLEKNPDYWDTANIPVIDTYTYQVIVDPASAIAALQTGSADVFDGIPFQQANDIRASNPDLQIVDYDTLSFNYYYVNQDETKETMFTDVKVRQALQYALDRDLIGNTVYDGFAIRADGTQPVLSIAYRPDEINTIYLYDPEKAAQLLDEAGWTVGDDGIRQKDGVRMSFECLFSEGVATYETQVPYMQQAWREVGIEMLPTAIPFPTLSESAESGNYQMVIQGFNWAVNGDQSIMFASDRTPPDGFNRMRYSNPDYDALVEPSNRELDVEKRIGMLIEQSNIVNDDAAIGINVFRKNITGAGPRVRNFFPNGYGTVWWLTRAWLQDE